jgi:hypothetical protein
LLTTGSLKHTPQAVVLAFKRNECLAAFYPNSADIQVIVQDRLGLSLRNEQDEREPSVHGTHVAKGDRRNRSAFEVQFEPSTRIAAGYEPFPDAEHLEQFDCACLDGERARLTCPVVQAVDDSKASSEILELRGQRESRRTGANDQRIKSPVVLRHPLLPSRDRAALRVINGSESYPF